MSGLGFDLKKIYGKKTISNYVLGALYSSISTVAPMLLVIGTIMLIWWAVDLDSVGFFQRELFSCTVLYIFIFAMLVSSLLNSVLSKYMSDVIYDETYDDIIACFYVGLLITIAAGCLPGIPFCIHEVFVGGVPLYYAFTGFCGYISLILVLYTMLYLSICKDYKRISFFYFLGMLLAFLLSLIFIRLLGFEKTYAVLLSLTCGFMLTACLEIATVKQYFRENSRRYKKVLIYCRDNWRLIATNFLYTAGLYVHNFVFWTSDLKMVIADSFVCAPVYDMSTCFALFTNFSAAVVFISRVEMNFFSRYKDYSESIIGGRMIDIKKSRKRMLDQLSAEIMSLARIQLISSLIIYLLFVIFLPMQGLVGYVMQIYPCLAAGYFILFISYACMLFQYYLKDYTGSLITAGSGFAVTLLVSIPARDLSPTWYGIGFTVGCFAAWTFAYWRMRWYAKNISIFTFCAGNILQKGKGVMPDCKVYDKFALNKGHEEEINNG